MASSWQFDRIQSKLASIEDQQKQVRKELAETAEDVEAMARANKMLKGGTKMADIAKENQKLNNRIKNLRYENDRLRQDRDKKRSKLLSENAKLKTQINQLTNGDVNSDYGDDRSRKRKRPCKQRLESTVKQEIQLKDRLRSSSRTASTIKRESPIEERSEAPSPDESLINSGSPNTTESSMVKTESPGANLNPWATSLPFRGYAPWNF